MHRLHIIFSSAARVLLPWMLVATSLHGVHGNNSNGNNNIESILGVHWEDILTLLRYLIGLGFVIFATFFTLYNDFALRVFLSRYDETRIIQGTVVSCVQRKEAITSRKYTIQVVYSLGQQQQQQQKEKQAQAQSQIIVNSDAKVPLVDEDTEMGNHYEEISDPILNQEFMHTFTSNWLLPDGEKVDMYCIAEQPRSAITLDFFQEQRNSFSCGTICTYLLPAIAVAGIFVGLSIHIIMDFPHDRQWVGWMILTIFLGIIIFFSWGFCDTRFCEWALVTFLSSHPVYRKPVLTSSTREAGGRERNGIFVPPQNIVIDQTTTSSSAPPSSSSSSSSFIKAALSSSSTSHKKVKIDNRRMESATIV